MEAGSFTQQVFGQTFVELRYNQPDNQLMAFFFFFFKERHVYRELRVLYNTNHYATSIRPKRISRIFLSVCLVEKMEK